MRHFSRINRDCKTGRVNNPLKERSARYMAAGIVCLSYCVDYIYVGGRQCFDFSPRYWGCLTDPAQAGIFPDNATAAEISIADGKEACLNKVSGLTSECGAKTRGVLAALVFITGSMWFATMILGVLCVNGFQILERRRRRGRGEAEVGDMELASVRDGDDGQGGLLLTEAERAVADDAGGAASATAVMAQVEERRLQQGRRVLSDGTISYARFCKITTLCAFLCIVTPLLMTMLGYLNKGPVEGLAGQMTFSFCDGPASRCYNNASFFKEYTGHTVAETNNLITAAEACKQIACDVNATDWFLLP